VLNRQIEAGVKKKKFSKPGKEKKGLQSIERGKEDVK